MFRFTLIITFAIITPLLSAPKKDNIKKENVLQDSNCTLIETCKAGICIYACNINGIDFNRYIMESMDFEKAYATWLELTNTNDLPLELPKENTAYKNELTTIKFTWHNKQTFDISLYESEVLIGSLQIYNNGKYTIIDDKLNCIMNY